MIVIFIPLTVPWLNTVILYITVSPKAYGAGVTTILVNAKSTTSIPATSESSESVLASVSPGIPVPSPWIPGSLGLDVVASLSVPSSPPASSSGSVSKAPSLSPVIKEEIGGLGPDPSGSVTAVAPDISALLT